jgi:hypothetical protein
VGRERIELGDGIFMGRDVGLVLASFSLKKKQGRWYGKATLQAQFQSLGWSSGGGEVDSARWRRLS